MILLGLALAQPQDPKAPDGPSVRVTPGWIEAGRAATVTVRWSGFSAAPTLRVRDPLARGNAAVRFQIVSAAGNSAQIRLQTSARGYLEVTAANARQQTARATLSVWNRAQDRQRTPNRYILVMPPTINQAAVRELLQRNRFTVPGRTENLPGNFIRLGQGGGICGGIMALVDAPAGANPVAAIAQLTALLGNSVYEIDPEHVPGYSQPAGPANPSPAGAVGAGGDPGAGSGATIAVIDTGVSQVAGELEPPRLLPGFNSLTLGSGGEDAQGPAGHGTGVALIAASAVRGVAPAAQVLPVRVCARDGQCTASSVIVGVCWALANGPRPLVVNLSLGSWVPSSILSRITLEATQQGVWFAAAGGNDGKTTNLPNFPAAFSPSISGLVAVAALKWNVKQWAPATYSTRGPYIDVAAPAQPDGTSFATPLVAGAMARWAASNLDGSLQGGNCAVPVSSYPPTAPPPAADQVGRGMLSLTNCP